MEKQMESKDMKDRTNTHCSRCRRGKYKELYFHDDMDGVLHCDKCGQTVNRYEKDDGKLKRR